MRLISWATKLDAFEERGKHDYFTSRDLEDVLAVIDGRPELLADVKQAPHDLRTFLRRELKLFLSDPRFIHALPGHLPPDGASQARLPVLLRRIGEVAGLP